jgi:prophage antirepressor-like protein
MESNVSTTSRSKTFELFNHLLEDPTKLKEIENENTSDPRKPQDVKESYYQQQKLVCESNDGERIYFYVWTLFVIWHDDSINFWMNALDVIRGLGYQNERVQESISSYLSGEDRIVTWESIRDFLFTPTLVRGPSVQERGVINANNNVSRTVFLTEEGLYEVYQFAPKCKPFRRTVANLLKFIRKSLGSSVLSITDKQLKAIVANEVESERERLQAEKREEIDALQTEFKKRTADLKTKYDEESKNHQEKINELTAERDALRVESENLRAKNVAAGEELRRTRAETLNARASLESTRREYKDIIERINLARTILQNPVNFFPLGGRLRFGQEDSFCILWIGKINLSTDNDDEITDQRDLYLMLCRQRRSLPDELRQFYQDPENYGMIGYVRGTELDKEHLDHYRADRFSFQSYPCYDRVFNEAQHKRYLCAASNSVGFKSSLICKSEQTDQEHPQHLLELNSAECDVMAGRKKIRKCARSSVFETLSENERANIERMRGKNLENYDCEECKQENNSIRASIAAVTDNIPLAHRTPLRRVYVKDKVTTLAYNCDKKMEVEEVLSAIEKNYNAYRGNVMEPYVNQFI